MNSDLLTRAARFLTVGFEGPELDDDLRSLLDRGVGGVVFFARNVGTPNDVARLIHQIKRHAGRPLWASVDHEGGLVARLRQGFTTVVPMRALGATGDAELAERVGRVLGREVAAVGFDLNFAPVLDVDTNPDNPIIGNRSLSRDAEVVARLGSALVRGIQSANVAACAKHFPGHGDTSQDSHLELPRLPHPLERLEQVELVPFQASVSSGVASVMTAHVVFEALDSRYPTTMSAAVLQGILRERMGYDGFVITDDIEMQAITENFALEEVLVRALNAGVDNLLACHTAEVAHSAIDSIAKAVERGDIEPAKFAAAERRLARFTERYATPPLASPELAVLGSAEHSAVIDEVRRRVDASMIEPGVDPTEVMEMIRRKQRLKKA